MGGGKRPGREVRVELLEEFRRLTEGIGRAERPEEFCAVALEALDRAVHPDRAAVLVFDVDGALRFKAWRGLSEGYRRAVEGHLPWPRDVRDPKPVLIPDVAAASKELGRLRDVVEQEGIRALAFVPLVHRGRLLGKFVVYYDRPHAFTPPEVIFAQVIAGQIGLALGRHAAEQALQFLAEAGGVLAESLEFETTLARLARLAVPVLADWCEVDVRGEDGKLRSVAVAHVDPAEQVLLERETRAAATSLAARHPVAEVLRSGRPKLLAEVGERELQSLARSPAHLELLRRLAPRSLMIVPLVARGEVLGAITFAMSRSGRRYDEPDLALGEQLARHAATAVENARLYEAALAASQVKSDFLAIMSHELRTPLTAILGYADLLEAGISGALTEAQLRQVRRIKASAQHLLQLIEEILAFSRMEAGREEVRVERVDLDALLQDVAAVAEPLALDKGLAFELRAAPDLGVVHVDGTKVRQILLHLLSNAVKFTEQGRITLEAEIPDDRLVLRVTDTGIGIRPEHLERIFEPFWQIEHPMTRRFGGTGLGLTVVRRLAHLMGGEVRVSSVPGRGTTFEVVLPARRAPPAARARRRARRRA